MPARVLPERGQAADLQRRGVHGLRLAGAEPRRLDALLAEVAEEVAPAQAAQRLVTDHDAAGDRAPAVGVAARDHGLHRAGRTLAGLVAPAAPGRPPAEVRALALAAADEVDLLDRVLPDVADDQVAGLAVERVPPRVAQAVAVDLRPRARAVHERVVGGDRVGLAARLLRVDPQDLPERRGEVLCVAARPVLVARAATVAGADVHVLVRAEQQQAAVVVGLRVVHPQHEPLGARVGAGRARALELDDALVLRLVGEVDVEPARARVVGRERDRQQALLASRRDLRADVEEGALLAAGEHADAARLLDDEQALRVARLGGDVDGLVEVPDGLQPHSAARARG